MPQHKSDPIIERAKPLHDLAGAVTRLEVVARTFEEPNRPQTYSRAAKYITNVILQATNIPDITLVHVDGIVEKLRKMGVNADYINF